MKRKIGKVLEKIYGVLMIVAFFGGTIPLIPFIICIIVGGPIAESVSIFLYKEYYKWIIILASMAVIVGLVSMYLKGDDSLSIKSINGKNIK